MPFPTAVNSQITDLVPEADIKAPDEAPSAAMEVLAEMLAQSLGMAGHNAVEGQPSGREPIVASKARGK